MASDRLFNSTYTYPWTREGVSILFPGQVTRCHGYIDIQVTPLMAFLFRLIYQAVCGLLNSGDSKQGVKMMRYKEKVS